jgi:hypothetical protein
MNDYDQAMVDSDEWETGLRRGKFARAQQIVARRSGTLVRSGYPWEPVSDRFDSEPPVGTVLRWRRPVGPGLDYVATRAGNGHWYVTGQQHGPQSWAQIVAWIGDNPAAVAIDWRDIPAPDPAPSGDDAVREWAAGFLPVLPGPGAEDVPAEDTATFEGTTPEYHADGRHRHLTDQGKVMYRGITHTHYVATQAPGSLVISTHEHEDGPNTQGWSVPENDMPQAPEDMRYADEAESTNHRHVHPDGTPKSITGEHHHGVMGYGSSHSHSAERPYWSGPV